VSFFPLPEKFPSCPPSVPLLYARKPASGLVLDCLILLNLFREWCACSLPSQAGHNSLALSTNFVSGFSFPWTPRLSSPLPLFSILSPFLKVVSLQFRSEPSGRLSNFVKTSPPFLPPSFGGPFLPRRLFLFPRDCRW